MDSKWLSRREFFKAAVAIGGTSALAACLEREGKAEGAEPSFPQGPDDLSTLPARQFAWNDYLVRDANQNTRLPEHQTLLFFDYGEGEPTAEDRSTVENALETLERAYRRGTGGAPSAILNDGLLFTISYTAAYFDRFDESLPDSVDLRPTADVLRTLGEDPAKADEYDALLVLTSDSPSVVLSAEQAMLGEKDRLNGVDVTDALVPPFELAERRTGFVGKGLPHERLDEDRIPENSPMAMGYRSGLRENQATEDRITITEGPFADGTVQMVSKLMLDLDHWYDNDDDARRHLMFSPAHSEDEVGEVGDPLAGHSRITEEQAEDTDRHAREEGMVGHTQKIARARDDEFTPRILRRSEGINTDGDRPGFNFSSVQQGVEAFVDVRRAMNGDDLDEELDHAHNGILDYLELTNRAVLLIPPRSHRALPTPNP